jgi:hypothetical protein
MLIFVPSNSNVDIMEVITNDVTKPWIDYIYHGASNGSFMFDINNH